MIRLTRKPVDILPLLEARAPSCGAFVFFVGKVRNHNEDKKVDAVEYTAYEKMARRQLKKIENETRRKFPVKHMHIFHRLGTLSVGDISLAVAVFSPHRKEAFRALEFAVESIKKDVPVFKKEFLKSGAVRHVTCCDSH